MQGLGKMQATHARERLGMGHAPEPDATGEKRKMQAQNADRFGWRIAADMGKNACTCLWKLHSILRLPLPDRLF